MFRSTGRSHYPECAFTDWLVRGELQKMVLVITSSETREVLERWTFDLQTDKSVVGGG